jgi:hypothetical protein
VEAVLKGDVGELSFKVHMMWESSVEVTMGW